MNMAMAQPRIAERTSHLSIRSDDTPNDLYRIVMPAAYWIVEEATLGRQLACIEGEIRRVHEPVVGQRGSGVAAASICLSLTIHIYLFNVQIAK